MKNRLIIQLLLFREKNLTRPYLALFLLLSSFHLSAKTPVEHYTAKIDVFGKHLSGILAVKTIDSTEKRMVFTTETGFKYFDFHYIKDSVIVEDCISPLKRNGLLPVLSSDLNTLVYYSQKALIKQKLKKDSAVLLIRTKTGKVVQKRMKLEMKITIKHRGFPIKYTFTKLNENGVE